MPDLAKLGGRACLAAEYICLTSGSFRMIHSPTCSSSPPSHDDINIPARTMPTAPVMLGRGLASKASY